MQKNYKRMQHNEFLQHIDKICNQLGRYIQDNGIKIDYICPVLRSGVVPAVYISNKLNIVKFLPIQVKHIAYKNGENKIEMKNRYKDAKILYVCLTKQYGSRGFENIVEYEDTAFYYNGNNEFSKEKCEELNVQYFYPLFPWENLKMELEHPDDLEENIFF